MAINMLDYKSYTSSGAKPTKPSKHNRNERRDILRLVTARYLVVLGDNQFFCETKAAYEIWEEGADVLLHRVKRIPKKSVLWVIEK